MSIKSIMESEQSFQRKSSESAFSRMLTLYFCLTALLFAVFSVNFSSYYLFTNNYDILAIMQVLLNLPIVFIIFNIIARLVALHRLTTI